MSKERPILFSAPMVRAILDGRKTVTRRVVKPQPKPFVGPGSMSGDFSWPNKGGLSYTISNKPNGPDDYTSRCPYGGPGDRLWVRETWGLHDTQPSDGPERARLYYKATDGDRHELRYQRWRPSIHMPRWASRITLEVVSVRVERLQDITEEDAKAEGIRPFTKDGVLMKWWPCDPCDGPLKCSWQDLPRTAREAFKVLWEFINGPGSWAANPWVWRIEFRRIKP